MSNDTPYDFFDFEDGQTDNDNIGSDKAGDRRGPWLLRWCKRLTDRVLT